MTFHRRTIELDPARLRTGKSTVAFHGTPLRPPRVPAPVVVFCYKTVGGSCATLLRIGRRIPAQVRTPVRDTTNIGRALHTPATGNRG
jgi:hypothetical protein